MTPRSAQQKSCDKIKGQKSDGLGCCTACLKTFFQSPAASLTLGHLVWVDPPRSTREPMWEAAQDVERRAFCRQEELETRFEAGSGMIE